VIREYAWLDGLPIGQFAPGSGGSPADTAIDNSDAGAAPTGGWTTATAGSGYLGANYHELLPGPTPPGGTTVDNTDAGFKTLGLWSTQAAPAGFEGADYRRRAPSDGNGAEIVIDNTDAAVTYSGNWTVSAVYGSY
jgi:hypothetical protein